MNIKQELEESKILSENVKYNIPMKNYTSFKIGGPAEYFVQIKNAEELQEALKIHQQTKEPLTIIGNGSNLLVNDNGIKGIVLQINIKKLEIQEEKDSIKVIVGSGNKLGELAQKLAQKEIAGFEFASGIPGTIGGAIRMNAGAHGTEMKDIVQTITYVDKMGKIHKMTAEQAKFQYRKSIFAEKDYIIIEAELKLQKGNKKEIQEKMQEYAKYRKEKQPLEYPSAGSTFKRGEDFITAKLIDECGLKGYQIGGAQISEKHAGFIINKGNATAEDVLKLIEYTKEQVYKKFNKVIETEIEVI